MGLWAHSYYLCAREQDIINEHENLAKNSERNYCIPNNNNNNQCYECNINNKKKNQKLNYL